MLSIRSSKKFTLEKNYVWHILLNEFLGLDYQLVYDEAAQDYHITLDNDRSLILSNQFFSRYTEESYAQAEHIPDSVATLTHALTHQDAVPVIYGTPHLQVGEHQIRCEIDIVASSFFMLTRWEEYAVTQRDEHDRFPLQASLAHRAKFYQQPVVDQYAELLWSMLHLLDSRLTRKRYKFRVIPTHDVNQTKRWRGWRHPWSVPFHDFVVKKNARGALRNLQSILEVKLGLKDDPYDTFNYLMRTSEKFGLQSRFYLMAGGETPHDNHYRLEEARVQSLIETIKSRGHQVGFHPSYNSYTRPLLWQQERDALNDLLPKRVSKGRQHYLRFELPTTWQIWEDAGMTVDSSMGYPEAPGFRCGTCRIFPVFNFLTRQTLSLYESPLICSDVNLIEYMRLTPEAADAEVSRVYAQVKKYQGDFVLLWQNTSLFTEEGTPYRRLYEKMLRGF